MTSRWQWLLLQLSRKLWFRASLFSVLAIATALAAIVLKPYIPADISTQVGADAVDKILGVIAASMLAVTIFSLSTMVSAYIAANSNVTPRAIRLLDEDATAHNALGTFIGAFLFSLVGIIALSTGMYGVQGRLVLFVVTLAVIAFVVMTLLHWIDHVSTLGQVAETSGRIEAATSAAMRARHQRPYLGGRPLLDPAREIPANATPLFAERIGYVQHIDMDALAGLATGQADAAIYLGALPGTFVDPSRPLAWVGGIDHNAMQDDVRAAFTIGQLRSFDQDPRFGMSVLSEIASRALSPAVNDPGTAIDILGRAVRLLSIWSVPREIADDEVRYPQVHVPGVDVAELYDDLFNPIARDGAALVEVGIRLQKSLRALARLGDARHVASARRHSALALERAMLALAIDADKQVLRALAAEVGTPAADPQTSPASFYTGPPAAGAIDVQSDPTADAPSA
ncbi:DUF2254 domain-containing protein [Novilysobacter erysipheiresistens]|uniref:DUF2254 domain-containing protein n=1 Tax=Novilysobacter erysipheiresistens TaxID=1749332 RepID=A0ABU7YVV4_9GAMM